MQQTVYRIESKSNHLGPFNNPECPEASLFTMMWCHGVPDGKINDEIAEFCNKYGDCHVRYGCVDLKGINIWFPQVLRATLAKFGYVLNKYTLKPNANYMTPGCHQIIYNPNDTVERETLDIITMH